VVAYAGADLDARVDDGRLLRPGTSLLLAQGSTLRFGEARDGARGCLGLPGGLDVPRVLGSASNAPVGGFGGIEGRRLRIGDALAPARPADLDAGGRAWPGPGPSSGVARMFGPRILRLVDGPHHGRFEGAARVALLEVEWTVDPRSDRVGVRLAGPELPAWPAPAPVSFGMAWGALELPPRGQPIVLLADGPTVGGYPVPAVVAAVDRPALGQLRPGDRVRFEWVDLGVAHALRRVADAELAEAVARIRMARAVG
jgi:antagonist of KipI